MHAKKALCIGNNAYEPKHLTLKPCVYDAGDLADSLHSIGFKEMFYADLDYDAMKTVTRQFIKSIERDSIVLFYFSGHGVQHDGINYLIPTNAIGISAQNIAFTGINVQKIIEKMYKKYPKLIIFILDCCRTEAPEIPIDGNIMQRIFTGLLLGFAPMTGPPSTLIAYACAADDVASPESRNGRNSLYTYYLLKHIGTPNVDVDTLLRYVAMDVDKESRHQQVPYRYSSCNEPIYLAVNKHRRSPLPSPRIRRSTSSHVLPEVNRVDNRDFRGVQPAFEQFRNLSIPNNVQHGSYLNYHRANGSPSRVMPNPWNFDNSKVPRHWHVRP